jgi:DNA-binding transcriptional LysR family regulator
MDYSLAQLRIFHKITQTMSITKAASELHLTQPAVSIQLKKFQEQFQLPLTEVVGRQLYITDFGKEIAKNIETILEGVDALNFKTDVHEGRLTGKLRISAVSTGKYVIPYFIADFAKTNPAIELFIDVTNKAKVFESLENNEVDFSLVSAKPDKIHTESIKLMQNKLCLVTNNQLCIKKKMYDYSIFEKHPLIFREQGSATRTIMERFIQGQNIRILKKIELTSNEAVKQAVIAGLGISIMPLIGIKNELSNKQLQIIPVKNFPIITDWHLIWMRNKRFGPAANAFLSYLKKEKDQIINDKFDWFAKHR